MQDDDRTPFYIIMRAPRCRIISLSITFFKTRRLIEQGKSKKKAAQKLTFSDSPIVASGMC